MGRWPPKVKDPVGIPEVRIESLRQKDREPESILESPDMAKASGADGVILSGTMGQDENRKRPPDKGV